MRLCSRVIREKDFEKDDLLVELSYFAFSNGKYDETTLQYLILFYAGTTEGLYAIWKAAGDFEVPAAQLEERLLCEILFTENHVAEGCEVFASYYKSISWLLRIPLSGSWTDSRREDFSDYGN